VSGFNRTVAPAESSVVSGFSRTVAQDQSHQHVESEIGRGYGPLSLKSELASMRARQVVESGSWTDMKAQGSFDNIDELFALGEASIQLRDLGRAQAAADHLGTAAKSVPDADAREIAAIMAAQMDGLLRLTRGDRAGGLAALQRAAALEVRRPRPIARPYPIKPAGELYAEALAGAGDARAAIDQFEAALTRTPNRAAALLGLARAQHAAGQSAEAARAAKTFLAIWRHADQNRPELTEASGWASRKGGASPAPTIRVPTTRVP